MKEGLPPDAIPNPTMIHSIEDFGGGLRGLRCLAGLSVRELEQATEKYAPGKKHLTRSTISRLENGVRLPRIEQLNAFLVECGVGMQKSREWRAARNRLDPAIAQKQARNQQDPRQDAAKPEQSPALDLVPSAKTDDSRPLFECRCKGVDRSYPCSAGVWWNPVIRRCDWPHYVYKDLIMALGLDHAHGERECGDFPNPEEPRTWYQVDHSRGYLKDCPKPNLWWNPTKNACDWPESVYKDLMARWNLVAA